MSPIAFSILLFTLVTIVTVVQGDCPTGQTLPALTAVYAYIGKCAFPTANLNKACVKASCPSLTNSKVCPTKTDGSFNNVSVAAQINDCFCTMKTLCGSKWDPVPFPQIGLTGLSLPGVATFTCTLPPTGVNLTGLLQTRLDSISAVSGQPGAYALSFSSPQAQLAGLITCTLNVNVLGFSAPAVAVPLTGVYTASYTSTATVSTKASPPTVDDTCPQVTHNLNVVPPAILPIPPIVLQPLLDFAQSAFLNAGDDAQFASYVALFIAYALQVLQNNC